MALIYTRQVRPLGFKGSGMFDSSRWHLNYYRVFHKERVILGICGGLDPDGVWRYDLTSKQMKAWEANKLSVTPPGCCSASQRSSLKAYKWVHEGTIKNLRHLKQILATTGLFPELK
jgi:hypothetical protein